MDGRSPAGIISKGQAEFCQMFWCPSASDAFWPSLFFLHVRCLGYDVQDVQEWSPWVQGGLEKAAELPTYSFRLQLPDASKLWCTARNKITEIFKEKLLDASKPAH